MKFLLVLILITNIVIIWVFFIRGNVRFNIDREKDGVRAEMEITAETQEKTPESVSDESLVTKSTIHISEIRSAVADMLPGMVKEEVQVIFQEKDVVFDDDYKAHKSSDSIPDSRFKPVKDVDKAFEDNRTEGPAEGQEVAPDEDDESVPSFDDLDRNMKTLKDDKATPHEKSNAVGAMLSVDGTNLVMSLPEPLHSNFINLIADYTAKQIDGEEEKEATTKSESTTPKTTPKPKKAKELPDSIADFRIRDYKN